METKTSICKSITKSDTFAGRDAGVVMQVYDVLFEDGTLGKMFEPTTAPAPVEAGKQYTFTAVPTRQGNLKITLVPVNEKGEPTTDRDLRITRLACLNTAVEMYKLLPEDQRKGDTLLQIKLIAQGNEQHVLRS